MYTKFKTFCGTYSGTDADKTNLMTNEYADIQRKSTFGGQNGIEHSAPAITRVPMVEFGALYMSDGSAVPGSPRPPIELVRPSEIGMILRR